VRETLETELDLLVDLAVLDKEIVRVRTQLEKIPGSIEARREEYQEPEKALEGAREELSTAKKERRRAEGELDGHLEKIKKLNDQQNLVKTNKEYQALLGEIEKLKAQQDAHEEKILELMEWSGEEEKKIAVAEGVVAEAREVFEVEEARLLAEEKELRSTLEGVESARAKKVASVEQENLHMYSRVQSLRGDAVAEVVDELCLGCRVAVPPQKFADVMLNKVIQTCSHCNRILYYRGKDRVGSEER
jgi:predicted  nucleic acid-binding Zn-ribbon protein